MSESRTKVFGPVLVVIFLCVAGTCFAAELKPRAQVVKPARTQVDPNLFRSDVITVKFRDGLMVRLRDGTLSDMGTGALGGAEAVLAGVAQGRWERAHSLPEARLDQLRRTAQDNLGKTVADLNLQYNLRLPAGADPAAAIDTFNALNNVEIALPVPIPVPPPIPPDYEPNQGHLDPATGGIDAECMWLVPGGTGIGIKVADLEYSWNLNHDEVSSATLLGATPNDPFSNDDHGTAVLGEVGALRNGWGVTGAAYDSTMYVVATNTGPDAGVWDVGAAVTTALGTLVAGDVIIIEQQFGGPNYPGGATQFGLIPVEWWLPWYNAIVTAVGNGVIVVEAAGNGSQDLDAAVYSTGNGGHWPFLPANDSGAIIVGAGAPPGHLDGDRSRLGFSNWGSTVDLQGRGGQVYTTGYGDAYSAEGKNRFFTSLFSGTSSASPIVASACITLQAAYKANTGIVLTPAQAKSHLQATGSGQLDGTNPASQNIGPRPNAAAALTVALPSADADGNMTPDVCESGACVSPPMVTSNIASRYIEIRPDTGSAQAVALRVTNRCTGQDGWIQLAQPEYDDGAQGLVNVGITVASCEDLEFRTPASWLGSGDKLVVTGDIISPNTTFDVEAICGGCANQFSSGTATTANRTWVYSDASGDGQVTFFADLFKMFGNTASVGFPFWTGSDPGYKVDTQGATVPDQQTTFFADISSAFGATSAAGCDTWPGVTCCQVDSDCAPSCEVCAGGQCVP
ncbi:MAG: S8 family serine peptidase [Phycisphaerae bacterium]